MRWISGLVGNWDERIVSHMFENMYKDCGCIVTSRNYSFTAIFNVQRLNHINDSVFCLCDVFTGSETYKSAILSLIPQSRLKVKPPCSHNSVNAQVVTKAVEPSCSGRSSAVNQRVGPVETCLEYAHMHNLALQAALKIPSVARLTGGVRRIAAFFHHSPVSCN